MREEVARLTAENRLRDKCMAERMSVGSGIGTVKTKTLEHERPINAVPNAMRRQPRSEMEKEMQEWYPESRRQSSKLTEQF